MTGMRPRMTWKWIDHGTYYLAFADSARSNLRYRTDARDGRIVLTVQRTLTGEREVLGTFDTEDQARTWAEMDRDLTLPAVEEA